jgi:hypothetical protein
MRAIVIADCHGRPDLISNALDHAGATENDRIIFAGDFLDIGPKPFECFRLLKEVRAEFLMGNHELAILLDEKIRPQDKISFRFAEELNRMDIARELPVATRHDNVIITHAGICEFYRTILEEEDGNLDKLVEQINEESLREMWDNNSPVWFRPGFLLPLPGIKQVCGHTPPEMIDTYKDYVSVDPFSRRAFGTDRYRYAVIENDEVTVFDSNE